MDIRPDCTFQHGVRFEIYVRYCINVLYILFICLFYKIVINENKRTMGYPEFIKTKEHGVTNDIS